MLQCTFLGDENSISEWKTLHLGATMGKQLIIIVYVTLGYMANFLCTNYQTDRTLAQLYCLFFLIDTKFLDETILHR